MSVTIRPGSPEALISLDASVHNIPTTYGAGAGSAIRVGKSASRTHFCLINNTNTDIEISIDGGITGHYVCPAGADAIFDGIALTGAISIRSLGSAITTGTCYLSVW